MCTKLETFSQFIHDQKMPPGLQVVVHVLSVFGWIFLDHAKWNLCIFSGVDFAVKSFYLPLCTPIQLGIFQSVLKDFNYIHCGAAKMWKLYIESSIMKAL